MNVPDDVARRGAAHAARCSSFERASTRDDDLHREPSPASVADHDDRLRTVERYREEYHDAQARIITAVSTVRLDAVVGERRAFRNDSRVKIRVVKSAPAPVMDGFDVRGMRAGRVYEVDARTGKYLILAGYAMGADDEPTR